MPLATLDSVRYSIGTRVLLDDARLSIEDEERIGLVGRNGAGKSTLMRLIAGDLRPDAGSVLLQRGQRVSHLTQEPSLDRARTLLEEAASAFTSVEAAHARLDVVFQAMADAQGDDLRRLLAEQSSLEREIERAGGYALTHRVERVLHGLGFTDAQFSLKVGVLSGGQRARLALAKMLLEEPDLLLLDEPTNHLDIDGREWLEEFLAEEFKGAVVLISHDRYLLDRVVDRIIEVEHARLYEYPGGYEEFREIRARRRLTATRAYQNQQATFAREEAYIRRYKAGQRAKQARGRATRLARAREQDQLDRPPELGVMSFELPTPDRSGDLVVVMNAGTIVHRGPSAEDEPGVPAGEKVLFRSLDLKVTRGERWGVIGPNGAGKTSLIRAMLGEQPLSTGSVRLGSNVSVGYFRQTHEHIDPDVPVFEFLQRVIKRENPGTTLSEQRARDLAGAFLFTGREQDKPMGSLSGGERSRALLAGLLASSKNLLILDEPTNHLDIPSSERLEDTLARGDEGDKTTFAGTVILISHDRALIDAVCDQLIVLDGKGGATVFPGTYTEWVERRRSLAAQAEAAAVQARATKASAPRSKSPEPARRRPYSWMSVDQLEEKIAALEGEVRAIEEDLGRSYADGARCRELASKRDRVQAELAAYEEEWLSRG